jgi:hypothetical protein
MRHLLLAAALASCAPSVIDLGAMPVDVSAGDAAPSEDAGRPDVAHAIEDATDGAAAPDAATVADAATEDATDASAESSVDVSADATDVTDHDASDVTDASETTVCAATCEGLPHVIEAECINGTLCAIRRCERDFADCNHASADGCETDLSTTLNCRSCGVRCPPRFVCANFGCG